MHQKIWDIIFDHAILAPKNSVCRQNLKLCDLSWDKILNKLGFALNRIQTHTQTHKTHIYKHTHTSILTKTHSHINTNTYLMHTMIKNTDRDRKNKHIQANDSIHTQTLKDTQT